MRISISRRQALAAFLAAPVLATAERARANAPSCTLNIEGAGPLDLASLKGQVVYLDFWASWCTPCLLSFPFMNSLQKEFAAKGLRIIAVNMDKNADDARAFLAKHHPAFDVTAGANPSCAQAFGVADMPSTFLIDRSGMTRVSHNGFREGDADFLRSHVTMLLSESVSK